MTFEEKTEKTKDDLAEEEQTTNLSMKLTLSTAAIRIINADKTLGHNSQQDGD